MINVIDNYYLRQEESVRETMLAIKALVLSLHSAITPEWKYSAPFFYYRKRMMCYLATNKQSGLPYMGIVYGNLIDHPLLVKGNRIRMKILPLDPEADLPVEEITDILQRSIAILDGKLLRCK